MVGLCSFVLILYDTKTIFQSCWDRSSWVLNCRNTDTEQRIKYLVLIKGHKVLLGWQGLVGEH